MERSAALATYNAQLLAPLTAVIERQSETIRKQAETIGRQGAELSTARGTLGELQGRYDQSVTLVSRLIAAGVALAILALAAGIIAATGWVR